VAAIVSVLLHDLVVRDRPATICGRERNPTRIESAIRARFVRDSFHSLSTGLPTGLPPPSWTRMDPVPLRRATLGTAWKMRAVKGRDERRPRPRAEVERSTGPTRGQHSSCRDITAERADRPPACRGSGRIAAWPGGYSGPDRDAMARVAARRAGRSGLVRQRLPDLREACIFRVARCTRGLECGWNPLAGAQPRRAIRHP
jgi:hypothetical protein